MLAKAQDVTTCIGHDKLPTLEESDLIEKAEWSVGPEIPRKGKDANSLPPPPQDLVTVTGPPSTCGPLAAPKGVPRRGSAVPEYG